jgi:predicted GTPase
MAQTRDHDMVLVMGLSGAGKSYFINRLTGMAVDVVEEGKKLKSCKSSLRNPTVNWSLTR